MKFLDFFAGIGGFRIGMEMAGHECVGHIEIDKYANKSYEAMHKPKKGEYHATDIRTVKPWDLPEADCYCGGFPCQAFSIAGKRGGFEDTRGTLFFEVARLAKERKPKLLLLENVKGLLNHDNGNTFEVIIRTLDELGYWFEWQVLNSKNFGVPQNRERVFIVGHLRGTAGQEVFPIRGYDETTIKGGEISNSSPREFGFCKTSPTLLARDYKDPKWVRHYKQEIKQIGNLFPTVLTPGRPEKRQNGRRFKADGEDMFTITAQDRHGVMIRETEDGFHAYRNDKKKSSIQGTHVTYPDGKSHCLEAAHKPMTTDGVRIRRLTPIECFRLQGFPDEYFHRAQAVNSDSQLYKQAGNSVTVNVIYEIARRL